MKFISSVVLIMLLAAFLQSFLPWWICILVAGLVVSFYDMPTSWRFLAGFLALFLLWGGYAAYLNQDNSGILAERMGLLLGGLSGSVLVFITGFFGGLFGGLGALTASLGLNIVRDNK